MNYNRFIGAGRLVADPEVKQGAKAFVVFTLAINGMDKEVNFIPCVAFGKTGEVISKYAKKASTILVEGKFTTRKGDKGTFYNVVVDKFEFGDRPTTEKKTEKEDNPF